jgi:predicted enzyme involved in methoxymalonyl-ACP biosynthesis
VGVRDTRGVSWEDVSVVNLSRDPSLHESHVLVSRELNRLPVSVEPGKRVVADERVSICVVHKER